MNKIAVVAIGGNSLIKDKGHSSIQDQYQTIKETCIHIVELVKSGYNVLVTHGNGPQVGFNLRRSELASHELHEVPLDYCGAETQGSLGYQIQQAMTNEFHKVGLLMPVSTVVTQVIVSSQDPAFTHPTKPIGSFMSKSEALKRQKEDQWQIVEDAGRGYRRVVPSPKPLEIVEIKAIQTLLNTGFCVIAVGGGGIPVIKDESGCLRGVAAVIDKDFSTSLLACEVQADLFIISTAVEKVCLNFQQSDQQELEKMTHQQAMKYLNDGHFEPGSMQPKVKAAIEFVDTCGQRAIITSPSSIARAIRGETGTHIVKG